MPQVDIIVFLIAPEEIRINCPVQFTIKIYVRSAAVFGSVPHKCYAGTRKGELGFITGIAGVN
jgi:hypothetical protein